MATMEELLMMATDDKDAYAPGSDFAAYLESNKKIIDNKLKNNDKSYFVNDKQLSKFIDPDTAPVPVLEQFAKNPNYSPESTDYSFGDAQIKSILLKNRQNKKNEANTYISAWWLPKTNIQDGIAKVFKQMKEDRQ